MLTVAWWLFILLIILIGIFGKIYLLPVMGVMLFIVGLVADKWQRSSLEGVNYRRRFLYKRGFPGEKLDVRIEVENRKFLPISWLRADDPWPYAVGPENQDELRATHLQDTGIMVNLFALRWYERARRTYCLLLRQRGVYAIGPALLESGDLFGLFSKGKEEIHSDYLAVFPEALPFDSLHLPTDDPFGDRRARRRLYEDPNLMMGVRDYRPEDEFRRVHWPATAHTGSLQVKIYQPVSSQQMVVCLNVTTVPNHWEGTIPDLLEFLIRAAASVCQRGIEDGYQVGLLSNGCLAHSDQPFRVPPGRSPDQLARLLETLAGTTPFTIGRFDHFLRKEASRLPYGANLVVITGLIWPELSETLLQIKRHNRRITLLSFAKEPPPAIPGIKVYHIPYLSGK